MKVKIIRTNGQEEEHEVSVDGLFPWIERKIGARGGLGAVTLRRGESIMWIDDTGAIQEPVPPVNAKATELYHATCMPGTTWPIVGDVAITSEREYVAESGQGEDD